MAHDATKDAHGGGHGDQIAHTMEPWMLIAVWLGLMFFTGLTVYCSRIGLGPQASFMVAMIIATIKGGLVTAFFMHLWWDKRLNMFVFLGAFLFVMLFISMALTDKSEYTPDINRKIADDAAMNAK